MAERPLLPIPVEAAWLIAKEYGYDQVVIFGRRVGNAPAPYGEHVTTFGATLEHKPVAARIGDLIAEKVAGWAGEGQLHQSNAICSVARERQRQIDKLGFTAENDDRCDVQELADAAACYALNAAGYAWAHNPPQFWPWEAAAWKPKDARADLVRAAALILAEIERLDRAADVAREHP